MQAFSFLAKLDISLLAPAATGKDRNQVALINPTGLHIAISPDVVTLYSNDEMHTPTHGVSIRVDDLVKLRDILYDAETIAENLRDKRADGMPILEPVQARVREVALEKLAS